MKYWGENKFRRETQRQAVTGDTSDVTSYRWVRKCLPDEYKQQKKRRDLEESTSDLRNSFPNIDKNVPEQRAMAIDTEGYEAFGNVNQIHETALAVQAANNFLFPL